MSLATLSITPEPWTVAAVCATTNPDAWFPEPGTSTKPATTVCQTCPVRAECLDYAVRTNQRDGIWGGMTPQQIRNMRAEVTA